MGPPEAVDREFLYIVFLFCVCFGSRAFFFLPSAFFLLSSWLILPHLGSIWGHLGSILGSSWLHLEPSWPHLEPSWLHLGSPECVFGAWPSLYRGLFEGDLRKCNTYATCFSTLHFIEVKVVCFSKNRFPIRERAFRNHVKYDLSKTM